MKILIAVTGSISAYKTPDIVKGLLNNGHTIKVICSNGAKNFINPNVFKYIGVENVYDESDDFIYKGVLHIELARWCDTMAILPLSANTLSKLSSGQAEGLIQSVFLSLNSSTNKILYPAMNSVMFENLITKNNLKILSQLPNTHIIMPDSGILACGEEGIGKLPSVESIVETLPLFLSKKINKTVIITAGATLSSLDPVRYVTNPAKGGTAYVIAKKYLSEGYRVLVIKGVDSLKSFHFLKKHPNYKEEIVVTTNDLLNTVKKHIKNCDIYISPMAVSDIEFEYENDKIKKNNMNGVFKFKQAVDVLKFAIENKKEHTKVVGFAAETSLSEEILNEKLKRKPVDLLVANFASSGLQSGIKQGFGTKSGHYKLVYQNQIEEFTDLNKSDLANYIFNKIY